MNSGIRKLIRAASVATFAAAIAGAAVPGASAAPQDFVTNGSFNSGVAGWTVDAGAELSMHGGGGMLSNEKNFAVVETTVFAHQCIDLPVAGMAVTASGRAFIPKAQVRSGIARIVVELYQEPGCNDFLMAGFPLTVTEPGAWKEFSYTPVPMAGQARSARVRLDVVKHVSKLVDRAEPFAAVFDDVALVGTIPGDGPYACFCGVDEDEDDVASDGTGEPEDDAPVPADADDDPAEEPAAEEPVADEPVADEPAADEPVVEDPAADEPAIAEDEPSQDVPAEEPVVPAAPTTESEPLFDVAEEVPGGEPPADGDQAASDSPEYGTPEGTNSGSNDDAQADAEFDDTVEDANDAGGHHQQTNNGQATPASGTPGVPATGSGAEAFEDGTSMAAYAGLLVTFAGAAGLAVLALVAVMRKRRTHEG